jgi:hypothetical protein
MTAEPAQATMHGLPILCLLALALAANLHAGKPPRIAAWDPSTGASHLRFTVDAPWLDRVADWIADGGMVRERIPTGRIATGLDPLHMPVLTLLPGDTVPHDAQKALIAYSDAGGILVGLAATVPFLIRITPTPSGPAAWDVSPSTPLFAWQTGELREALGIRHVYRPALHLALNGAEAQRLEVGLMADGDDGQPPLPHGVYAAAARFTDGAAAVVLNPCEHRGDAPAMRSERGVCWTESRLTLAERCVVRIRPQVGQR